jgi:hypothetical protein
MKLEKKTIEEEKLAKINTVSDTCEKTTKSIYLCHQNPRKRGEKMWP